MFTGLIATIFAVVLNATVFPPIVFGGTVIGEPPTEPAVAPIVRYEATDVIVYEDGSFTLNANGNVYAGCLPSISTDGTPSACSSDYADNITTWEDGSGIWFLDANTEIGACFIKDWGCE